MARLLQLTSAGLLILSLGLHWAVLQSVAWTTMLVERSQTASITQAVRTTFDGQHPCKLCRVVAAGQHDEKKSAASLKLVKLELSIPAPSALLLRPAQPVQVVAHPTRIWRLRAEVPPVPPPRCA